MTRRLILIPFVALLAVAAIFAACGDDDNKASTTPAATTAAASGTVKASATPKASTAAAPTEAEAKTFLVGLVDTYNAGDIAGFLKLYSDEALNSLVGDDPGTPRAQAETDAQTNLTASHINAGDVTKISSTASSITVHFASDDGKVLTSENFTLANGTDGLIVEAYEHKEPEFPSAAKKVTVEGTEFQYIFDKSEITDGNVGFEFSNIGSQFHMLYLLKVDATTPKDDIVAAAVAATNPSELPASVTEDLGLTVASPGQTGNYVPVKPLESGRYLFICFIPDEADNIAHATKGMNAEFTIP